jgi:hypothetical protein
VLTRIQFQKHREAVTVTAAGPKNKAYEADIDRSNAR